VISELPFASQCQLNSPKQHHKKQGRHTIGSPLKLSHSNAKVCFKIHNFVIVQKFIRIHRNLQFQIKLSTKLWVLFENSSSDINKTSNINELRAPKFQNPKLLQELIAELFAELDFNHNSWRAIRQARTVRIRRNSLVNLHL